MCWCSEEKGEALDSVKNAVQLGLKQKKAKKDKVVEEVNADDDDDDVDLLGDIDF